MARVPGKRPSLADVRELCRLHVSQREMAAVWRTSLRNIEEWLGDPEFKEAVDQGEGEGKRSLRRAQLDAAMAGDRVMLIWMGKQLLGQKEPEQRLEHSGRGGGAIAYQDMDQNDRKRRLDELVQRRSASGELMTDKKRQAAAGRKMVEEQAGKQVKVA